MEYENIVIHIMFFGSVTSLSSILFDTDLHPSHKSKIANLMAKIAPIKISANYAIFIDIFFLDLASKFLRISGLMIMLLSWLMVNNHPIGLFIA